MRKSKKLFSVIFIRLIFSLVVVYLVVFIIFVISYNYYYNNFVIPNEIDSVVESVNNTINLGYDILIKYSEKNQNIAKELLFELSSSFVEEDMRAVDERLGNIKFDGTNIDRIDYYLIKDGVISETSYEKDLGFNFKEINADFWTFLQNELEENEYFISNMGFESRTNIPRLYGYRKLDENTIFEIGMILDTDYTQNFIGYFQNLLIKRRVERIELYNVIFIPYDESFKPLSDREKEIFTEIQGNFGVELTEISNMKSLLYIKWQSNTKEFQVTLYFKIYLDFSGIMTLKGHFILLVLILIIVGFVLLVINYLNLKKYLDPLSKRIKKINIDGENYVKSGIYEFDVLEHIHRREVEKQRYLKEAFRKEKNTYQELAKKDPLTGLRNLFGCKEILAKLLREEYESSVVYIDLDDLKEVNDKYGHDVGDKIIIEFSEILEEEIRETDCACRLGGDEFLLIIPHAGKRAAKNIVNRINKNLFNRNKGERIKISFSYGFDDTNNKSTVEDLIKAADKRMYENKRRKKY